MKKLELGQVFTNEKIADFMVELFTIKTNGKVLEPCAGAGVFLSSLKQKKNYYNIYANELDDKYYNILVNRFNNINIYNEEFLFWNINEKYDGIIMNPPFIRHEDIDRLKDYGITKRKLHEKTIFQNLSMRSNIYMYFVIKSIHLLNNYGELVVILPSSWINSDIGRSFKFELQKQVNIEEIYYIKGNAYKESVIVDSVIMKCKKNSDKKLRIFEVNLMQDTTYIVNKTTSVYELKNGIEFNKYASIRRGIETGYNKAFINPDIKDINVLPNIISSPKDIQGFNTEGCSVDKLFMINSEKDKSSSIKEYEEVIKNTVILNKSPKGIYNKINSGKEWNEINTFDCRGLIFSYMIRDKFKFILNDSIPYVRDNFYIIKPKIDKYILLALLNNYYTYLQLEIIGKKYGNGMLKIQVNDFNNLKLFNLKNISKSDVSKLKELGKDISKNKNNSISEVTKLLSKYDDLDYEEILEQFNSSYVSRRVE